MNNYVLIRQCSLSNYYKVNIAYTVLCLINYVLCQLQNTVLTMSKKI